MSIDVEDRYADDGDDPDPSMLPSLDVDASQLVPPDGAFLVAWLDDQPVGCGALRRRDDATAEIKRMYTVPTARRHGVSRAVLAALEAEAVGLRYEHLVLETGLRQPEAIALYEAAGWHPIASYGPYRSSPLSACFAKVLR